MIHFPIEKKREFNKNTGLLDIVIKSPCPYGERDLQTDNCYDGSGLNKCPYFIKYDWVNYNGHIVCNHPEKKIQGELF